MSDFSSLLWWKTVTFAPAKYRSKKGGSVFRMRSRSSVLIWGIQSIYKDLNKRQSMLLNPKNARGHWPARVPQTGVHKLRADCISTSHLAGTLVLRGSWWWLGLVLMLGWWLSIGKLLTREDHVYLGNVRVEVSMPVQRVKEWLIDYLRWAPYGLSYGFRNSLVA